MKMCIKNGRCAWKSLYKFNYECKHDGQCDFQVYPANFAQEAKGRICPVCDGSGEVAFPPFDHMQVCHWCNGSGKLSLVC